MINELNEMFPKHTFESHIDEETNREFVAMDGEMIATSWNVADLEDPTIRDAILEALVFFVNTHNRIHG